MRFLALLLFFFRSFTSLERACHGVQLRHGGNLLKSAAERLDESHKHRRCIYRHDFILTFDLCVFSCGCMSSMWSEVVRFGQQITALVNAQFGQ